MNPIDLRSWGTQKGMEIGPIPGLDKAGFPALKTLSGDNPRIEYLFLTIATIRSGLSLFCACSRVDDRGDMELNNVQ